MPVHHEKDHPKNEGVKLAGNPAYLINRMIKDPVENKWAAREITQEGPWHKQVWSALLLNGLHTLLRTLERERGKPFRLQKGFEWSLHKEQEGKTLHLPAPIQIPAGQDQKKWQKPFAARLPMNYWPTVCVFRSSSGQ